MVQSFTETITTASPPPPSVDEKYVLDTRLVLDGDAATQAQSLTISTAGDPAPAIVLAEIFEPGVGEETVIEITVRAFQRTKP